MAVANLRKHGISFDRARTVYLDEHALIPADLDHCAEDERLFAWD